MSLDYEDDFSTDLEDDDDINDDVEEEVDEELVEEEIEPVQFLEEDDDELNEQSDYVGMDPAQYPTYGYKKAKPNKKK